MQKLVKFAGLLVGIVVADIIIFSPGFIGVSFSSESALETASAAAILLGSCLAMIYGIYQIGFKPANKTPVKMLKTPDDFAASLVSYKGIKPLSNEITSALSQMERLKRKMETFKNVLSEQFSPTELSYQKFMTVATEVEKLFYQNVRSILNRLSTFDASEYDRLQSSGTSSFSPSVFEEKRKVYADYITFVKGSVSSNEEILLKVDKLLLEISKLDSFELAEIENMSAMKEMDALITQTKLYKQ